MPRPARRRLACQASRWFRAPADRRGSWSVQQETEARTWPHPQPWLRIPSQMPAAYVQAQAQAQVQTQTRAPRTQAPAQFQAHARSRMKAQALAEALPLVRAPTDVAPQTQRPAASACRSSTMRWRRGKGFLPCGRVGNLRGYSGLPQHCRCLRVQQHRVPHEFGRPEVRSALPRCCACGAW